ncbi:hypothetical protein HMPREF1991_02385 [Hoylesella loescheii DSM 19665 = JCM 12249 = ATCC 15930]|uniref:Uncharacterized protein n=1 Tax=Hoylesella loescheii DSM 19665 = JCM 12249 = ATCC 15930 TaxID=1122985 RepID=A0A069QNY6_HOYLO|nr:hypothetical protein HMPREF1991_02385 [Hoylesella loescheii DSM 19665 = JCM 12249 = ATCC 15930]
MMNYYINRRARDVLDDCSMLSGMLFQLNWNTVPANPEQGSILALTGRKIKKLTTRVYRVENERWRLEVGRMNWWW